MGHQQLLLLVLAIVIVGLAFFMGVFVFNEEMRQSQADDVMNRNVRIAQEAVNWRGRSRIHGGGGGGAFDPLATDGLETLGVADEIPYAAHAIITASGNVFEVVGVSTSHPEVGAYVRVNGDEIDSTAVSVDGGITLP
jgi:hypothetical protein